MSTPAEIVWHKLLAAERERREEYMLTASGQRSTAAMKRGPARQADGLRCAVLAEVLCDAFDAYLTPFAAQMAARAEIDRRRESER